MAYDKVIDSTLLNKGMTATANAIRAKTGNTSPIVWDADNGFKAAVEKISDGVVLPELTNPATDTDLALNKQLIDANGNVITGSVVTYDYQVGWKNRTPTIDGDSDVKFSINTTVPYLFRKGVYLSSPLSNFGDATAADVAKGKTFTSVDGLKVAGKHECNSIDDFIQGQITTIQNENITEVGRGAFAYTNIENIDLPNCTTVKDYAFANCNSLKDINLPQCKDVKDYAFYQVNIEELTFPKGEDFGYQCFSYSKIKTIILPMSKKIGNYCFSNCSLLTNIDAPLLENINTYCFQKCTSLKEVQFDSVKKISNNAFNGSTNIFYMTLLSTEKVTLESSNAFLSTPFASGKGYIFVPAEIVDTYKQDSVWKTYQNRIFAIAPTIIEPSQSGVIEQTGSRNYSLDLKFFDSVPQVSFSGLSKCTITNKEVTQDNLSFTLNGINLGKENVTIIATIGEEQATLVLPIEVIEKLPYEVNNRSTTYGFYLNDNDYYESNNKGKDTSYAVCRVTFTFDEETQVYLDCINYAENNWDYGILSNIDTELSLSNTADASGKIYKNFKGLNSSSVQTVTYTIPAGEHFIDIKYLKDTSNSSNNDSLQFKIRFE